MFERVFYLSLDTVKKYLPCQAPSYPGIVLKPANPANPALLLTKYSRITLAPISDKEKNGFGHLALSGRFSWGLLRPSVFWITG
jgi:hypothetical protein